MDYEQQIDSRHISSIQLKKTYDPTLDQNEKTLKRQLSSKSSIPRLELACLIKETNVKPNIQSSLNTKHVQSSYINFPKYHSPLETRNSVQYLQY